MGPFFRNELDSFGAAGDGVAVCVYGVGLTEPGEDMDAHVIRLGGDILKGGGNPWAKSGRRE